MSHTATYKIAIIGSSLSGLIAANALSRQHTVDLFESGAQIGGTLSSDTHDAKALSIEGQLPLFFAPQLHPNFNTTVRQLGIKTNTCGMSFGYHAQVSDLSYSNKWPFGIISQPRTLMTSTNVRMLREIIQFRYRAKKDLRTQRLSEQTLQDYLSRYAYSEIFIQAYLIPLLLGVIIATSTEIRRLPARIILEILKKHGLLEFGQKAQYKTVKGGYQRYIQATVSRWRATCHLNTTVLKIHRNPQVVEIETADRKHAFDYVIIATSADRALDLIQTPTQDESRLLSQWRYATGTRIHHTDKNRLPHNKHIWGNRHCSHNEGSSEHGDYLNSYPLNTVQKNKSKTDYFLSSYPESSPLQKPADDTVIKKTSFRYPRLSIESLRTQSELPSLNNKERSFFCGPYFGNTAIESDVTSAIQVLHHFNCQI
jgi:uncharacterized protein